MQKTSKDTKSKLLDAIDVDRYAQRREEEFLAVARESGDERAIKLIQQLASDEKNHVRRLEELARKLGGYVSA